MHSSLRKLQVLLLLLALFVAIVVGFIDVSVVCLFSRLWSLLSLLLLSFVFTLTQTWTAMGRSTKQKRLKYLHAKNLIFKAYSSWQNQNYRPFFNTQSTQAQCDKFFITTLKTFFPNRFCRKTLSISAASPETFDHNVNNVLSVFCLNTLSVLGASQTTDFTFESPVCFFCMPGTFCRNTLYQLQEPSQTLPSIPLFFCMHMTGIVHHRWITVRDRTRTACPFLASTAPQRVGEEDHENGIGMPPPPPAAGAKARNVPKTWM